MSPAGRPGFRAGLQVLTGVALAVAGASPAGAQTVSGEFQPRTEVRWVDGSTDAFTSHRARIGVRRDFSWPGAVFLQFQDVRVWGSEASTTDGAADAVDLHEGWLEVGVRGASRLWLRVGRQELAYGTERLVGAPDWTPQSQSFDGVRGTLRLGGDVLLDAFAAQVAENASGGSGDAAFVGVWGQKPLERGGRLAAYLLADVEGRAARTDRWTVGTDGRVAVGPVTLGLEAALQEPDGPGSATLLAVRVDVPAGPSGLVVTGGFDRLSGRAPGDEGPVFSRLYGRAHRFYGYADVFRNIEADTGRRGLVDLLLRARLPVGSVASLQLDLHRFRAAETGLLDDPRFGDEADLVVRWAGWAGPDVTAGLSWFDEGPALADVGRGGLGQWFGYLQLRAVF